MNVMAQFGHLLMRFKVNATFLLLCVLFVKASVARAQVYEFQFITSAPEFGGEFYFSMLLPEAGLLAKSSIVTPLSPPPTGRSQDPTA